MASDDNDAASDVWDRYNRGERNVFSRRLYTVRGQIVFDEVRARYRDERNFQRAVDDYIAKFERVLTNVPPDDVGQAAIRASLASDAGKVFMLLGHASGRFD